MVKLKTGPKTFQAKRAEKQAKKNEQLLIMSLSPHLSLSLFRDGEAQHENWMAVCFRITLGLYIAEVYFTPESGEYLHEAEMILHDIYQHAVHHDQWCIDENQHAVLRSALNLTDELCEMTTLNEQAPAWFKAASQMNLLEDPEIAEEALKALNRMK